MRITISIAEKTAKKLIEADLKLVENALNDFKSAVTKELIKTIPVEVLELSKKHSKYFDTRSSFVLHGNGFNHERIHLNEGYPFFQNYFYPNEEASKILVSCFLKYQKLEEKAEIKYNKIKSALVNLRTYANVKTHLPEAYELLPTQTTTALAINFKEIRNLIKQTA